MNINYREEEDLTQQIEYLRGLISSDPGLDGEGVGLRLKVQFCLFDYQYDGQISDDILKIIAGVMKTAEVETMKSNAPETRVLDTYPVNPPGVSAVDGKVNTIDRSYGLL